ncbi:Glutamine amidotransferases class-II [Bifidobacterium animalis subsp. animalis IM386]|uniref:Glutamine amidotransferases class-II n=1 Tax=Bifidobacterium animalis subsp. animalis IM386 TaxID=1402194 RepID=A0AAV2W476_9BIFI|nr:Glutamine amidotransferases class-II [Bifidobacterium animalis subsp. animalis IM386]
MPAAVFGDVEFHGGVDCRGGVVKSEMTQQHGGGKDRGGRVRDALASNVGGGTVDRLEHGRVFVARVDAAGRRITHTAHDGARLVGENVAEQIVGENHVEARRIGDQVDRGRVDVRVVMLNLGVFGAHLVHDVLPHVAGVDEHVLLVHERDVLAALHRQLEGVAHHAFDAVRRVDGDLGGHLVLGAAANRTAGAAVEAFGALTHHHEIDLARVRQRRLDARVQLRRAQIHILVEREPQLEQQAAFENARFDARVAHRTEQNRVGVLNAFEIFVRQNLAVTQIPLRPQVERLVLEGRHSLGGFFERLLCPRGHFLANAVAGNDGDRVLLCVLSHMGRLPARTRRFRAVFSSWTFRRERFA